MCIQIAAICGYGCPDGCTNLGHSSVGLADAASASVSLLVSSPDLSLSPSQPTAKGIINNEISASRMGRPRVGVYTRRTQTKAPRTAGPRGLNSPDGSRDYSEYIMYCSVRIISESAFLATRKVEKATLPSPEVKLTSSGDAVSGKMLVPSRYSMFPVR